MTLNQPNPLWDLLGTPQTENLQITNIMLKLNKGNEKIHNTHKKQSVLYASQGSGQGSSGHRKGQNVFMLREEKNISNLQEYHSHLNQVHSSRVRDPWIRKIRKSERLQVFFARQEIQSLQVAMVGRDA